MSSSSSSTFIRSQKPRIFRIDTDGNVYCNHDMVAVGRVAGNRSARQGEQFYGCPLWPRSDFKFFIWKAQVDALINNGGNCKLLEFKNKALEMKIANLEVEKMMLQEENNRLKKKLAFSNFMSKKAYVAVLIFLGAIYMYSSSEM